MFNPKIKRMIVPMLISQFVSRFSHHKFSTANSVASLLYRCKQKIPERLAEWLPDLPSVTGSYELEQKQWQDRTRVA